MPVRIRAHSPRRLSSARFTMRSGISQPTPGKPLSHRSGCVGTWSPGSSRRTGSSITMAPVSLEAAVPDVA